MCHDWEFEQIRNAYFEQLARRKRELEKAEPKAAPAVQPAPKPAEAPRVTDKEPVPA